MTNVDFLIIGQGLAGTLFADFALQQGHTVLVLNDESRIAASMVAAGMYTPVNPKRMSVSWMYDELYNSLVQTFSNLENQTGKRFFYPMEVYNAISSAKESNDFAEKLDNVQFASYINPTQQINMPIKQELGGFTIYKSGWVDLPSLILSYRQLLISKNAYKATSVDISKLRELDDGVEYENVKAKYVVSCVGNQLHDSGFFGKHRGTKGDTIIFETLGLPEDTILKKGIYLVPLLANRYKLGATYHRNFQSEVPEQEDAELLMQKFTNLTDLPIQIISHQAAIRPTTPDRKPVLGRMPHTNRIYVFNGLGTKGVTYGPYFAQHMFNYIVNGTPLIPEVDIKRYYQ
jgi:glycine oxidase